LALNCCSGDIATQLVNEEDKLTPRTSGGTAGHGILFTNPPDDQAEADEPAMVSPELSLEQPNEWYKNELDEARESAMQANSQITIINQEYCSLLGAEQTKVCAACGLATLLTLHQVVHFKELFQYCQFGRPISTEHAVTVDARRVKVHTASQDWRSSQNLSERSTSSLPNMNDEARLEEEKHVVQKAGKRQFLVSAH